MDFNDPTTLAIIATAVVGILTIILFVVKKFLGATKNKVLFVGLTDSGKTTIFTQLSQKIVEYPTSIKTFTSMVENKITLRIKDKEREIIDYPGNDRLRQKLIDTQLHSNSLLRIVFVVDSASFSKNARDVAELFYVVALENADKAPIMIACHKQDLSLAKTEKVIRNSLEREIGLINKSRSAALMGTDGSEKRATLTDTGVEFQWEDLKKQEVTFVTTSSVSEDCGIQEIAAFVRR